MHWNPYVKINAIFLGIVLLIMGYSLFFAITQTSPIIPSNYNFPVVSTGLSRAFVELIQGNISEAFRLNPHSVRIFLFFALEGIIRLLIIIVLLSTSISENRLIKIDVIQAVLLFLCTFGVVMASQIKMAILMYN